MNFKYLFIFLFLSIIFYSCQTKHSTEKEENNSTNLLESSIDGIYVSNEYYESLDSTKSPLKSSIKLTEVVALVIPKISSDSTEVLVNWNNHEGFDFKIFNLNISKNQVFDTNLKDFDNDNNYYKITLETKNDAEILNLTKFDGDNKELSTKIFIKINTVMGDKDLSWPIQFIVNKTLFNKKMIFKDKNGLSKEIKLTVDGKVIGHDSFKNYRITTDFLGEPTSDYDRITFSNDQKVEFHYHFKYELDNIKFYPATYNEESGLYLSNNNYEFLFENK